MTEIELKFILDQETMRQVRERLRQPGLDTTPPGTRNLHSVYYDTADHRLGKAGTALRLRRDGRRWTQTVKAGTTINGGLMRTHEVDNPAPGGRLDLAAIAEPALAGEICRLVGDAELAPVCETRMHRTVTILTAPGGARVELALDEGEIIAGELSQPFREAELELKQGHINALFDLIGLLMPEGGLRLSTLSKSARGYLLAETGDIRTAPLPRSAQPVPLDPAMTSEIAARDILRECFAQITANIDVVLATDMPEGPHQIRVGLRRLRAAFGLFRPIVGNREMQRLGTEARALGASVGALRDLDVLAGDLIAPAAAEYPAEPGFGILACAIDTRRDTAREALRAELRGRRVQSFQIELARFIETRGWLAPEDFGQTARLARPVTETAGAALDKRWKAVRHHARRIDTLTVEGRHELRKELKKLRYVIEFAAPLYPAREVATFVTRMKRLQDVFGELNDLAMAENLLCRPDSPAARDPAAQRAVGRILGSRTVRADADWHHARELWHAVRQTGPFWN
ncbi:CHAD domain-containing protein [Tropicimonas sp.]|uniref:CYTH and CHAD domain-containing protein n=1 Tax=Tropicimonas sp. TaxID=2067044 RepID=UPI003A86A782